jgi:putative transposase
LQAAEKQAIIALAKDEQYADLSHRTLAYTAMDSEELVTASPSSFYRVMRSEGLTGHRGIYRPHSGHGTPPEREELTGPMQRLCWDISYVRTLVKWVHLFLYVILDEWSRKVVAWRIDTQQSKAVVREMFETLFEEEGLLDIPEEERPAVINDRGAQMKAKTIKQMFTDLGMDQRYARPRTPNDNPFVESLFKTAKYHPDYPKRFRHLEDAEAYFDSFFNWYNTVHLHSGIGFVTPENKHNGLADEIFFRRKKAKKQAREARLRANQGLSDFQRTNEKQAFKARKQDLCVVLT